LSTFGDYPLNNFTQAISISGEQTMDNKKFESLIELIINENEEQARALFHDIVVEKSREIYESMMYEEAEEELEEAKDEDLEEGEEDLEEGMDQVEGLLDEIGAEEEGMVEDDEEFGGDDMGGDDMGGEEGDMGEESLEDRVVDLEDKLDELMAEFEEMMGDDGGDMGDDDMGGDMGGEEDFGDEEDFGAEEDEAAMMEAVQLQKVSVTHGDNGVQTKSPVSGGSKVSANGAKAVNFTSGDGGKGGTQGGLLNPATKDVKGAGQFKNAPGGKKADLEAAPKPKHGDDGADKRSPVAESKKSVKRIIKK
jgi:hypothetical protein